jgi:hypothetical protein
MTTEFAATPVINPTAEEAYSREATRAAFRRVKKNEHPH